MLVSKTHKFRRLKFLYMRRLDLITEVIIACCCFHNFVVEMSGPWWIRFWRTRILRRRWRPFIVTLTMLQHIVEKWREIGWKIVTDISSWQYLLLFFHPVLLICHIPEELPKFAAFFQASTAFHGQFHQFGVSILIESALKSCPNQIICGHWVPRVVGRDHR